MTTDSPTPDPSVNVNPSVPPRPTEEPTSRPQNATTPSLYRPPIGSEHGEFNSYEDKQWATFAHLGGITGFIPALIIFLIYKDRGRFTNQESKEALNFQITLAAAWIVCMIFSLIPLVGLLFALALLGLWAAMIIFSILAGISSNKGEPYRYPIAMRFIR